MMIRKETEGDDAATSNDERAKALAERQAEHREAVAFDEPVDRATPVPADRPSPPPRVEPEVVDEPKVVDEPVVVPTAARRAERPAVTDEDVKVMTRGQDLGIYRAHRRFGGFDLGAALSGALAAVGMTALLGGLAGGVGTVGYQLDVQRSTVTLSNGGFIAGLTVLVLSFLVGGWVAGRVARYDGGRNGFGAAAIFVVLSAVVAGLGAWLGDQYDVFANLELPQWFSTRATTATAVLSAVVALVVVLAAGWLGGKAGEHYHRKADAYLAEYAEGGSRGDIAPPLDLPTVPSGRRARRSLLH